MRQALKGTDYGLNPEFKNRGEEQTRIETFSDAVFALAVTLLILSSTVPQTFEQLQDSFSDIIPFGICITLLMLVWYQHYIFFIRYGFRDVKIVAMNTLLLFLLLVYVYPLKFLFSILYKLNLAIFTNDKEMFNHIFTVVIKPENTGELMIIYGLGASAVFIVMGLMFLVANNRRKALELSPIECYHTRSSVYNNFLMGSIPLLSAIVAATGIKYNFALSGMTYWLYAIAMPVFSIYRKKRKLKLFN